MLMVLLAAVSPSVFAQVTPLRAVMRIELAEQPIHNNFTRCLVFQNYNENAVSVPFAFTRKAYLVYEATYIPQAFDALSDMCREGFRGYWDDMRLENRGGDTPLSIAHVFLQISYSGNSSEGRRDVTILDWDVGEVLDSGSSVIYLNAYARSSRLKWVEQVVREDLGIEVTYGADTCPAFLAAVRDMGKCGTDGSDEYWANPKYGSGSANLCSEFISWYYHNEGTPIGKLKFRDITGHGWLLKLFEDRNRQYEFNVNTRQFEHSVTGEVYHPQPGDCLRRDDIPGDGHAMMIAGWNEETDTASVVNGPWPVTIRKVDVRAGELAGNKQYQLGRMN
ncbi:MAG: hypothetical protein JW955_09405 [Sedimentisphaerales bacterium]|nr:hypothetical protein [Sedimentisphaerales bacterium]